MDEYFYSNIRSICFTPRINHHARRTHHQSHSWSATRFFDETAHITLLVNVKPDLRGRSLPRPNSHTLTFECISLELHARTFGTFFFFFCYRPPNFSMLTFFPLLSEWLEQATNFPTFLLDDFNARHPLWNAARSHTAVTHLQNVLLDHDMRQCVFENVFVSDPNSDHCCVTADFCLPTPNSKHMILHRPDSFIFNYATYHHF